MGHHAYWRSKGLPTVIPLLFNTVVPRQSGRYGMVLPRFVEQALSGLDLNVYGDGSQTRCFAYVGDIVPAPPEAVRGLRVTWAARRARPARPRPRRHRAR